MWEGNHLLINESAARSLRGGQSALAGYTHSGTHCLVLYMFCCISFGSASHDDTSGGKHVLPVEIFSRHFAAGRPDDLYCRFGFAAVCCSECWPAITAEGGLPASCGQITGRLKGTYFYIRIMYFFTWEKGSSTVHSVG